MSLAAAAAVAACGAAASSPLAAAAAVAASAGATVGFSAVVDGVVAGDSVPDTQIHRATTFLFSFFVFLYWNKINYTQSFCQPVSNVCFFLNNIFLMSLEKTECMFH